MNKIRLIPQNMSIEYQNSQSLQRTAEAAEQQVQEVERLRGELEKIRQEFADYKAQQREQYRADGVQRIADNKQLRRHDYFVAAFTFALTLFVEHFTDVVDFAQVSLEAFIALFE